MKKNQSFVRRTLSFYKPFWKRFIVVIGIMFITQFVGSLAPLFFGKSIDALTNGNVTLVIQTVLISFGLYIFQNQILRFFGESYQEKYLDNDVPRDLTIRAIKKSFTFSIGQHINEHSGVKQNIITSGKNNLKNLIDTISYGILPAAIQVIALLIVLTIFDWRVASVALIFVLLYCFSAYKINKQFFPKIDTLRKKTQSIGKLESELYRNTVLVLSESQEKESVTGLDSSYNERDTYARKTWLSFLTYFYSSRTFISLGQYGSLAVGLYLILNGYHTVGMFVTMFSWISSIFGNLIMIMNMQRQLLFMTVEIKKFFDLLDIQPIIDLSKKGVTIENFKGSIEFKNVSFAYPARNSKLEEDQDTNNTTYEEKESEDAVTDISFTIPAGAKIGFVGKSGSGKSTIINLLRRYYDPTKGTVTIDGVPLTDIDIAWFRGHIGNVEQQIALFDRSVRDNILFPLGDQAHNVSDKQLNKIVRDAALDGFIKKIGEKGIDTMIGEGGIKVSGGERQRIGIARALIKNPKILIFDEATSALDAVNEKLIHEAINRGSEGRTTIIIAHRLSTVKDADKIFVVDKGRIVGEGTHDELIQTCIEYQDLIKNQIF